MQTFCVVVNWNGGEENLECLASLSAEGVAPGRIVFVDNGSTDGSLARVKDAYPDLVFVEHDVNLGFGGGSNAGARAALEGGAEAVFFVNNDVTLDAGTLARLERELEREGVGIVGPRVVFKDDPGRLWAAGGTLTWRQNLSSLDGNGAADGPRFRTVRDVDYVPGCALLASRETLEVAGLFDDAYFAYMEDVDLCLTAREHGLRSVMVGEVRARHGASRATGGGYSARRKYMNGVNSVRFLRRHGGPLQWLSFLVFDVASLPIVLLFGLVRGTARAALAKGLGIWHGLLGRRVTAERIESGATWLW